MTVPTGSSRNSAPGVAALLVAATAVGTLLFACVTPFPAVALVAAYALAPRQALAAVLLTWIANQAVGYGFMAYPLDLDTALWGVAIGAAAALATGLAAAVTWPGRTVAALAAAAGLAFSAYEGALYLVTSALGGESAFTLGIVGTFALVNAVAAVGLIAVLEMWNFARAAGLAPAVSRQ